MIKNSKKERKKLKNSLKINVFSIFTINVSNKMWDNGGEGRDEM